MGIQESRDFPKLLVGIGLIIIAIYTLVKPGTIVTPALTGLIGAYILSWHPVNDWVTDRRLLWNEMLKLPGSKNHHPQWRTIEKDGLTSNVRGKYMKITYWDDGERKSVTLNMAFKEPHEVLLVDDWKRDTVNWGFADWWDEFIRLSIGEYEKKADDKMIEYLKKRGYSIHVASTTKKDKDKSDDEQYD